MKSEWHWVMIVMSGVAGVLFGFLMGVVSERDHWVWRDVWKGWWA